MSSRHETYESILFVILFESRKNIEIDYDSTSNSNEEIIKNIVSRYLNSSNPKQVSPFDE
jgi:spore cortex formation protein SpoVR/YcgB (stage V sporulation)